MSFSESREVDSSLWLSKMMTGSGISPPSGSRWPWQPMVELGGEQERPAWSGKERRK